MCSSPDIPDPPPPPPPPPAPKPIEFGGSGGSKAKPTGARKALAIPLSVGGVGAGSSGLNIPS